MEMKTKAKVALVQMSGFFDKDKTIEKISIAEISTFNFFIEILLLKIFIELF